MTSPVDTLTANDVKELISEKYILILGDSVVRGIYKDLIKFSKSDDFLTEDELRIKGENRFSGDRLLHGGAQKGLTNGLDYEEVREYTAAGRFRIRFYFLTISYSAYTKDIVLNDIQNQAIKPDIIIMNSCLWDISRYGIYSMKWYQRNVDLVMESFRQICPNALFLWLSALPVSNSSKGGVIVPKAEYIRPILPGLIRDGNYYCSQMCDVHNVLYIDFHTTFSSMLHLRQPDGIHWCAIATRLMNEMILNHIKAYYHGVTDLKCPLLRAELGHKIHIFKQCIKKPRNHLKINSLNQHLSDDNTQSSSDEIPFSKLKRKRMNNDNDDDEKENDYYPRKIIIKSTAENNEQRTVVIKNITKNSNSNEEKKFDHEYCDTMYDNEFEGLQLAHFSSFDIEPISDIDIKPSNDCLIVPEEKKSDKLNYIVLSSDEEDELTPDTISSSSSTAILPIYLLNRLSN